MELTRRKLLAIGSSTFALASLSSLPAFASLTDDAIATLTGGADLGEGAITLTAPEIAENGNTVPIEFDAPGAAEVTLFADGNPVPSVATFKFGPLSGSRSASTRIRLAGTQNVVAIAKMEDGSFQMAKANVKVTIGGCGG
ncbi:thiosulfate-binding protein SoxY [Roseibium hamelinense]|uniref:Thiosulfate-binding protein SoxY n=1 Tax=Roseibium hamelinense TaxID=150831 RepID=A0A562STY7_9HYPH|nr:thiosulfate oxidation carrier protein SoxY [Roseibium hamelinense]MTI43196.1 thiosulfate oxidation carrier protein SoxY [Roseibium hamelinense]TWI84755.1 thiosulfate-binding protein SoxY [Roseibium hamelinense]